jgi:hypothetical protein
MEKIFYSYIEEERKTEEDITINIFDNEACLWATKEEVKKEIAWLEKWVKKPIKREIVKVIINIEKEE